MSATSIPLVDLRAQYLSIKTEIDAAIQSVLEETAFIGGPYVAAFESQFAEYCQAKHCIGVGNGTDAIFIVLKALGVGPGDEVITAANSFIATSEAISLSGAQVVFCDVDPDTYTLDVDALAKKISSKTKAIIPVHLYGRPAEMQPILELGRQHGLYVVEDAAQAHGALYRDQRVGSLGHVACFSFYPGKNLGAYGDGGAIVTNDDALAQRIRRFRDHGRVDKYDHEFEGMNSRLDGLQAAVLAVKLRHLDQWSTLRYAHAQSYNHQLSDVSELSCPNIPAAGEHVFHLYVLRTKHRDALKAHLNERGIGAGIHYPIALPSLKAYRHLGHSPEDFPIASRYQHEILSLPIYPELNSAQIVQIASTIKDFFRAARGS